MHAALPTHGFTRAGSLRRLLWLALGGIAFAAMPQGRAETALRPGEELKYSVRWAVLPSAGEIRIAAANHERDGADRISITTHTETRGLARSLITFHAQSESIYDADTGRAVSLSESSVVRSKRTRYSMRFDHANRQAWLANEGASEARAIPLPDGDPADLITTLMKTRLWDLRVGGSRDVLVSFRDDFYVLTVHAIKQERVKTALGEFETMVLEPRMEKTAPKGMFKRGGTVRVWVSRDEQRLPVRFQVEFKIGTGVATLVNYTPPAENAPAGSLVAD